MLSRVVSGPSITKMATKLRAITDLCHLCEIRAKTQHFLAVTSIYAHLSHGEPMYELWSWISHVSWLLLISEFPLESRIFTWSVFLSDPELWNMHRCWPKDYVLSIFKTLYIELHMKITHGKISHGIFTWSVNISELWNDSDPELWNEHRFDITFWAFSKLYT